MKWVNKGHEFDELGARLKNLDAIYLFGASIRGKAVCEKYNKKINIKGFIDNDTEKQGHDYSGLRVFSPIEVKLSVNEAIVITTSPVFVNGILEQLHSLGFVDNVFPMRLFFPVFDHYKFGEICVHFVTFVPSTICNLRCKHCLAWSPYIKKHPPRPIEQLKQDLELFFSKIDMLLWLHISGGEPLLFPHIIELIEYIDNNLRKKIGCIEMTTNGTIIPSDAVLTALKKNNIHVIIDDYCDALPAHFGVKHGELLKKLDEYGIGHNVLKHKSWIDLAPFETDNSNLNEEQICAHFNACDMPWLEYRNGKINLCDYAAFADVAGVQAMNSNDYFDLSELTADNRSEFMEYRLGYSEKGYTEFCKRCLGYNNNTKPIAVAEQL